MQVTESHTLAFSALFFDSETERHIRRVLQENRFVALLGFTGYESYRAAEGLLLNPAKAVSGRMVIVVDFRFSKSSPEQLIRLMQEVLPKLESDYLKLSRELLSWLPGVYIEIDRSRWEEKEVLNFRLAEKVDLQFLFRQFFSFVSQKCKLCYLIFRGAESLLSENKSEPGILNAIPYVNNNLSFVYCFESGSRPRRKAVTDQFKADSLFILQEPEAEHYSAAFTPLVKGQEKKVRDALEWLAEWCFFQPDQFYKLLIGLKYFESPPSSLSVLTAELSHHWIQADALYSHIRHLLTDRRWALARAVALENGVRQVLSSAFIQKYQLGGASTVKVSLLSLEEKEILREENKGWVLSDGLWRRWFREMNS